MSGSAYDLDWSFGLVSSAGKYLTAESFKCKIGATAGIMKKKQIWFLEATDGEEHVSIRSHLGKYLRVDGDGKFLGDGEQGDEETRLIIEAQADGRWLLKSQKYGWYAGGSGENLSAFTTEKAEHNMWVVHLAMHPQVCIKNVKRGRYMHLSEGSDSLNCDEDIPWGHDATISLKFFAGGLYGLQASNGLFLTASGQLAGEDDANNKFIIEFEGKQLSFKSSQNGKYVTALGASGLCKATKGAITKDEKFVMEDSWPQITLKGSNGKYVSIKQGVEVASKNAEVTDNEIFQVEPDSDSNWILKAANDKLWTFAADGVSVITEAKGLTAGTAPAECKFKIEFNGPNVTITPAGASAALAVQGNSYLKTKAGGDGADQFIYEIINRPQLVLRGEYGFVGTLPSGLLECNKSTPEVYSMSVVDGKCQIAHENGKFWKVGSNGVSCAGGTPEDYHIELYDNSMMCLKSGDQYFQGAQNGAFTLTGSKPDKSTFFEY